MESIFTFHNFIDDNFPIFEGYISNVIFNFKRNSITVEYFMTDNFKILKRVHDELAMGNAGNTFIGKTTYASNFLLTLHIYYSSQVSTISVTFDSD